MREKDAADYDLERFVEMFDQALNSDDPRVKNALRQLMMMVVLTDTSDHEGQKRSKHGPLRRMQEDVREQWQYFRRLEQEIEGLKKQMAFNDTRPKAPSGGFHAEDFTGEYQSATDYWTQVVAQTNAQKHSSPIHIPRSALQGLNIQVAADTGEK